MTTYTLRNTHGIEARVTDYGAVILSLLVPDREGRPADVVLGFDEPADYEDNPPYLGAVVGRYANRIAGGRFTLEGREYELARNEGPHHLHGGRRGFDSVVWESASFRDEGGDGVVFRHTSPDGDEGYPGTLAVEVRYTLNESDELVVDYRATTDRPTHLNLTQHSYFNLAGHDAGDVLDHVVELRADRFTPVDEGMIPTGELRDVAGTPLDFRHPTPLGSRIDAADEQLRRGSGYDHNYVIERSGGGGRSGSEPVLAARVYEPASGRQLEIRTTEPGIQLYSGNHLDVRGKGGVHYGPRTGLALETQHFPDSPNRPEFPSTVLRPGETFRSRTVWTFSTRERDAGGAASVTGGDEHG
jgi:aldose 1-epimerase